MSFFNQGSMVESLRVYLKWFGNPKKKENMIFFGHSCITLKFILTTSTVDYSGQTSHQLQNCIESTVHCCKYKYQKTIQWGCKFLKIQIIKNQNIHIITLLYSSNQARILNLKILLTSKPFDTSNTPS